MATDKPSFWRVVDANDRFGEGEDVGLAPPVAVFPRMGGPNGAPDKCRFYGIIVPRSWKSWQFADPLLESRPARLGSFRSRGPAAERY